MHSTISYIFGQIQAVQTPNRIIVSGFRTHSLLREIKKQTRTSLIESGMFYVTTGTRLEFPLFFAYDFLELLQQVKKNPGAFYDPKVIKTIEEELMKLPMFQRTIRHQIGSHLATSPMDLRAKFLSDFTLFLRESRVSTATARHQTALRKNDGTLTSTPRSLSIRRSISSARLV